MPRTRPRQLAYTGYLQQGCLSLLLHALEQKVWFQTCLSKFYRAKDLLLEPYTLTIQFARYIVICLIFMQFIRWRLHLP